ncbi:MAG: LON peptidase substrate-binding domain-containing protein, partial [Pseudomonadota bacterium]
EPRYLQMLEDCMKTDHRLIGMVQPFENRNGEQQLHTIGCAGRISQFSETEDGRYMITLTGISRYRITAEITGFTPYRRCEVNWDGFDLDRGKTETDPGFQRMAFLDSLKRYFSDQDLETDWDSLKEAEDELLINSLSMLCPFDTEDKQALLEAPSLSTRRETLVTLIEFSLRGGAGEDILQ